MFAIKKITFQSQDKGDKIFSRLDWRIEKVDNFLWSYFNFISAPETSKTWVGKVDRELREFTAIKTTPFLSGNFFQLFIHGSIIDIQSGSEVNINYKLGAISSLALFFNLLLPVLAIMSYLKHDSDGISTVVITIVFNGLLYLFLFLQINRTEKEILTTLQL